MWPTVKNLGGLAASVPSLLTLLRFLWIHDHIGNSLYALSLLPLNLIPLLLSDITFILDLGVIGAIGSLTMAIAYRSLRNIGQRMI